MTKYIPNKSCYAVLLFCMVFTIVSCKKDNVGLSSNGSSSYYIRFKANGIQKNYLIPMLSGSSHDSLSLMGKKMYLFETGAASNIMESIDFGVYSDRIVQANTYKEIDLVFGYQPKALMAYQVPGSLGYISCGLYDPQIFPPYNKSCIVIISSITKTEVKGTFSATLYQLDNTTDIPSFKDSVQIADGEFYMPVK